MPLQSWYFTLIRIPWWPPLTRAKWNVSTKEVTWSLIYGCLYCCNRGQGMLLVGGRGPKIHEYKRFEKIILMKIYNKSVDIQNNCHPIPLFYFLFYFNFFLGGGLSMHHFYSFNRNYATLCTIAYYNMKIRILLRWFLWNFYNLIWISSKS
jgi:hypothetical protein